MFKNKLLLVGILLLSLTACEKNEPKASSVHPQNPVIQNQNTNQVKPAPQNPFTYSPLKVIEERKTAQDAVSEVKNYKKYINQNMNRAKSLIKEYYVTQNHEYAAEAKQIIQAFRNPPDLSPLYNCESLGTSAADILAGELFNVDRMSLKHDIKYYKDNKSFCDSEIKSLLKYNKDHQYIVLDDKTPAPENCARVNYSLKLKNGTLHYSCDKL